MLLAMLANIVGLRMSLGTASAIAMWADILALLGSRFYFERRM